MNTMDSVEAFHAWFKNATPGSRFMYHVGNLAADRMRVLTETINGKRVAHEVRIKHVDDAAGTIRAYADKGRVVLFQQRVLPEVTDEATGQSRSRGVFAYYAMKTQPKGKLAREVRALGAERIGWENQYVNF